MQQKIRAIAKGAAAFIIMAITGTTGLVLRIVSLGLLTKFNRKYLIAASSRFTLFVVGIKLQLPPRKAFNHGKALYTFNHNSFFDVLILTALGLPNVKFMLSEKTFKLLPLTLCALAIGTLYIPVKKNASRRRKFFEKTAEKIQKGNFSVFASSEGVHRFIHGIAPFNKGIYHLATVCRLPVVPVYLHIPKPVNPFEGYHFSKGTIRVEIMEKIPTDFWTLEKLREHVAGVRKVFTEKFNESHSK